jgi:hypothetical protein
LITNLNTIKDAKSKLVNFKVSQIARRSAGRWFKTVAIDQNGQITQVVAEALDNNQDWLDKLLRRINLVFREDSPEYNTNEEVKENLLTKICY